MESKTKNYTQLISINANLYLKDPTSSNLGKRILETGLIYLDEVGLEEFSFRKLAIKISSTESSIYRYFENKHYFFVYLMNWYWEWMSTRIDYKTKKIEDPHKKFKKVISLLIDSTKTNNATPFIDEEILHRVVVREGTKAYHHKLVDNENLYGFFLSYKALCKKIANIIISLNPDYKYPLAMASTLIETSNNNIYFSKHLPRLTDIKDGRGMKTSLVNLLLDISMTSILKKE